MDDIKEMRSEIDAIDASIAQLYRQRMEVARRIGRFKLEHNLPVDDPQREAQLLTARTAELEPELRPGFERLLRELIRASKRCQRRETDIRPRDAVGEFLSRALFCDELPNGRIGYSGIEGCFAHCAVREMLPNAPAQGYNGFEAVFRALGCETDYGVLPIENSSAGGVMEVYDLLRRYGAYIAGEYVMPVRHCLLGVKGAELCDIRHVYSHSQALMQCRDFLSSHPSWECLPEVNTAVAARNIAQRGDITCAAVASKEAAELYGLEILKENINEQSGNYTRFIVVAPRPIFVRGADKLSLFLSLPHVSGSLAGLLDVFAEAGINLVKIESRPIRKKNWEYYFYIDAAADITNPCVRAAMAEAEQHAEYLEVLGACKSSI